MPLLCRRAGTAQCKNLPTLSHREALDKPLLLVATGRREVALAAYVGEGGSYWKSARMFCEDELVIASAW